MLGAVLLNLGAALVFSKPERQAIEVELRELDQRLQQIERLEDPGWLTLATF